MRWDLVLQMQWSSQASELLIELKSQFLNWLARNALSTTDFFFGGKMWFPPPPPREIVYVFLNSIYTYMTSLRTLVLKFTPTLAIISLESFCPLQEDPCAVSHNALAPFEVSHFPNLLSCFSVFDYSGLSFSISMCHWGHALSFSSTLFLILVSWALCPCLGAWLLSRGARFVQSLRDEDYLIYRHSCLLAVEQSCPPEVAGMNIFWSTEACPLKCLGVFRSVEMLLECAMKSPTVLGL